jgi:tetratricopeptide (TPR) repeat protein
MLFSRKKTGPEYYFRRGKECLERGDLHWALESFSMAIEFDPGYEMAYYQRAQVHKRLGSARMAVWDCVQFLEADRRMPEMVGDGKEALREAVNLARTELQRTKAKEEILAYGIGNLLDEMIGAYDPDAEHNDTRLYALALSWLRKHSPEDAYHIGFVHLLRKEVDQALRHFDKAAEADPHNPQLHYLRGATFTAKIGTLKKRGHVDRHKGEAARLSDAARSSFHQALMHGLGSSVCP